jgi:hypothetical protein
MPSDLHILLLNIIRFEERKKCTFAQLRDFDLIGPYPENFCFINPILLTLFALNLDNV